MYKITSQKEISENKILTSYIPKLDYDIISSHNLDFMKILKKYNDLELQPLNIAYLAISAAVTDYYLIYMTKLKRDILK